MNIADLRVSFVDHQFKGLEGVVSSHLLYRNVHFVYLEWRGIIIGNMPAERKIYETNLPWLDAADREVVFAAIDAALQPHFAAKYTAA